MEVKHRKHLHRHAGPLAIAGLAVAIGAAGLVALAPDFSVNAAHALVSSNVQVKTHRNGLAEVRFASAHPDNKASAGLVVTSAAGQRLHNQLLLESSGNQ